MTIDDLIEIDRHLLLLFNGSHSLFVDGLAVALTTAVTWIPLYVALFYLVLKNNENVRTILLILACAGVCLLLSGTVDDNIIKPGVARWRPTHDTVIGSQVDVVDGYRGGRYGFFSAHAANTMSIALFFCLLVRSSTLSVLMIAWSLINCWTRLYLGVHFPLDVACGLLWGAAVGAVVYLGYSYIIRKMGNVNGYISTHYTSTGYLYTDIDIVALVAALTLVYCLARACLIME